MFFSRWRPNKSRKFLLRAIFQRCLITFPTICQFAIHNVFGGCKTDNVPWRIRDTDSVRSTEIKKVFCCFWILNSVIRLPEDIYTGTHIYMHALFFMWCCINSTDYKNNTIGTKIPIIHNLFICRPTVKLILTHRLVWKTLNKNRLVYRM